MKNKKLNILFIAIITCSIFISSVLLQAISYNTVTFNEKDTLIDRYYSDVLEPRKSVLVESAPFTCTGTTKISCTGSDNISSISASEYNAIGRRSYLTTDDPYWVTGDETGTTANSVTIDGLKELAKENLSGARASVYIKESTKLTGSGTRRDPYRIEEYIPPVPEQDVNILAIYIDWNSDGDYEDRVGAEDESVARTSIPSDKSYVLDESMTNCTNGETVKWNTVSKSITISPLEGQTSCRVYLKNVTNYLVNAIAEPYKTNTAQGSLYNEFVGKYVIMDPSVCNSAGVCGLIPDPYNNLAVANPQSACSLNTTGGLTDESTGNCNVNITYCNSYPSYQSSLRNWRIVYVEDLYEPTDITYSNKNLEANIYIVSSRSVECNTYKTNPANTISNLNNAAKKYCNNAIVDGGTCNSTNVYAFNGTDFERISKYTRGRLNLASNTFITLTSCRDASSAQCFNSSKDANNFNSIVNNGEYYWFASAIGSYAVYTWIPDAMRVTSNNTNPFGLRPVLKLKSGIKYTGGTGTAEDPYKIIP